MTNAATTADRLLDAAEYRMRRGGYNAVSFRQLADDLGIRSASVHHHFARKETLTVALVERYAERFFAALEEHAGKTPEAKLRAFSALYKSALTDDGAMCLCGLLGSEMVVLPEPVQGAVKAFLRANIEWVAGVLPDDAPDGMADGIVAAHQGAMMLATSLGDPVIFDRIADTAIAAIPTASRPSDT